MVSVRWTILVKVRWTSDGFFRRKARSILLENSAGGRSGVLLFLPANAPLRSMALQPEVPMRNSGILADSPAMAWPMGSVMRAGLRSFPAADRVGP